MILINHIYINFVCKSLLRIKKYHIGYLKSYTFTYKIMYLSSIGFEVKSSKFNKIYNIFFRTLSSTCREKKSLSTYVFKYTLEQILYSFSILFKYIYFYLLIFYRI